MQNLNEENFENPLGKIEKISCHVQNSPLAVEKNTSNELTKQDESKTDDGVEVGENLDDDDAFANDDTSKKDQKELYLYMNLVIRIVVILNRLKLTPLTWNKKRKRIQITDNRFDYITWFAWVEVMTVIGIYATWRLLKEIFYPTPTFEGYKLLVYGMYYLLVLMFLVYDYTLIFKAQESVQLFNTYIAAEFALADVLSAKGRRFEEEDMKAYKRFRRILLHLTLGSNLAGLVIPLSAVFSNSDADPLRRFLMEHFPPDFVDSPWILGYFVVSMYLLIFHTVGIVYIGGMSSMIFTMRINHYLKFVLLEDKHELLLHDPLSAIKMHTYLQYTLRSINVWGEYLIPLLLLTGNIIHTLGMYSTITLYGVVPMPGYLYFPCFSINCALFELIVLPMAASLFERSVEAHHLWSSKPLEKWVAKKTRTMFPFGLQGGMFFMIKRETASTFFSTAVNNTIDLTMGFAI